MRGLPLSLLLLWILSTRPSMAQEIGNARGWPIDSHHLTVSIVPETHGLQAVDIVRLRGAGAEGNFRFLLHRDLTVHGVVLLDAGQRRDLDFESRQRWRPRDFWRRPNYRELAGYAIARQYSVAAPTGGWPQQPEIEISYSGAVYDSLHAPKVAYSRGFETTSGLIDPRGVYLHGGSFWVPWSSPERFTFRLDTQLPENWDSVSQGRRTSRTLVDGRRRTTWQVDYPEDVVYLVAGPYVVRERSHGDTALYAYTYADTDEATVEPYLSKAADYLDRYSEEFGAYPFAKWALVENWWQTGFGMPSFTLLGDRVIRLPFIVDTSYGHEILHCWWGNGVNVAYDQGNWCEGLTAFGADYQYKLDQSPKAARDYRRDQLRAYLDFASSESRDFALSEFRERSDFGTQAIGYGKCMMVFHMLRERLGPALFGRALAEFYRRWKFASAAWSDLEAVFSEVAGEDLSAWFDQWVSRPGAVRLTLGETRRDEGGWSIELVQQPPFFDAQVNVRWRRVDGEAVDLRAPISGSSTVIRVPAEASEVELDPDFDLFRRLDRREVVPTLGQTLGADSTLVILGEDAPPSVRHSLRELAQGWAENQNMTVLEESQVTKAARQGRSIYVLGPGRWARRVQERAEKVAEEAGGVLDRAADEKLSAIVSVRDPEDAQLSWTLVLPASAAVADALGRKIPHYSRYSWLLFDGEQNVGKGQWSLKATPLRRRLTEETP